LPVIYLGVEVEPVHWNGGNLSVLDQRKLPDYEEYLVATTPADVASAIRQMAVRGAPLIGIAGAYGLALAHVHGLDGKEALANLLSSRPTAVNLATALYRVADAPDPVAEAVSIHEEERERCLAMARAGSKLIKPGSGVMTYCNTGALATGGVGTALGVIIEAFRQGKVREAWVPETRPWLQGARLSSWELCRAGVPHRVITDNSAAYLMSKGMVDCVMVGADRVARNHDLANKIGTLGLALAARHFRVPFYVVAPTTSFDPETPTGSEITIEERDPGEVLGFGGRRVAPEGVSALNYAFDVTPAGFITAFVTEEGILEA